MITYVDRVVFVVKASEAKGGLIEASVGLDIWVFVP